MFRWALKWENDTKRGGGFLTQYVCSLFSLVQNNNKKEPEYYSKRNGEGRLGELKWKVSPGCVFSYRSRRESERWKTGGGRGAQVTSPSHPSTSIYVDGDELSGEWANGPVHLGSLPLVFPPLLFFFYFPSQSRGRSDVDKAECGPLRAFLLLLFRVFLYIFFFCPSLLLRDEIYPFWLHHI